MSGTRKRPPRLRQSGQRQTAEHWSESLEIEIELIRRHHHEQETVLETEIVKLEQEYQLEHLETEEDHSVARWWDVRSDYQPTECGSDGGQ